MLPVQLGNMKSDHDFWGRPEDIDDIGLERPAYVVNASHPGADMAAQASAALAASSKVATTTLKPKPWANFTL